MALQHQVVEDQETELSEDKEIICHLSTAKVVANYPQTKHIHAAFSHSLQCRAPCHGFLPETYHSTTGMMQPTRKAITTVAMEHEPTRTHLNGPVQQKLLQWRLQWPRRHSSEDEAYMRKTPPSMMTVAKPLTLHALFEQLLCERGTAAGGCMLQSARG